MSMLNFTTGYTGSITPPTYCSECGKQLVDISDTRYDPFSGTPMTIGRRSCPDKHEAWGISLAGIWTRML